MIGDTGLIGTFVCKIRAALPMLPGVILDRICPPEEEILEEEIPEEEIPEEDLILEGTPHYIEVTDLGDETLQLQYYHQKSGMIVTASHSIATFPDIVWTWFGDAVLSPTQYENAMAQYHNLGY